jgi:hypothetical protein
MNKTRRQYHINQKLLAFGMAAGLAGCSAGYWNNDYHLRAWERLRLQGESAFLDKDIEEAEDSYVMAIDEARKIQEDPPYHLGVSLVDLGKCYAIAKHPQTTQVLNDAIAVVEPAITYSNENSPTPVTSKLLLQNLAQAKSALADTYASEHDTKRAQDLYLESLAILDQWRINKSDSFEDNILGQDAAVVLFKLAEINKQAGHTAEAEKQYKQALSIARLSAAPYKTTQKIMQQYRSSLNTNGKTKQAADQDAQKLWIKYTVAAEQCLKNDPNDYAKSEQLHKKALAEAEKSGQDELNKALSLRALASIYYNAHRFAECNSCAEAALKIAENPSGGNAHLTDSLLSRLINSYCGTKNLTAAIATAKRLLAVRTQQLGANNLKTAECHMYLASLYQDNQQLELAKQEANLAFDFYGHDRPWRYKFVLDMEQLSDDLMDQEQFEKAHIIVRDALGFRHNIKPKKLMFLAQLLWRSYFLEKLEDPKKDCSAVKQEAREITVQLIPQQREAVKKLLNKLIVQFEKKKMTAEAQQLKLVAAGLPQRKE